MHKKCQKYAKYVHFNEIVHKYAIFIQFHANIQKYAKKNNSPLDSNISYYHPQFYNCYQNNLKKIVYLCLSTDNSKYILKLAYFFKLNYCKNCYRSIRFR